MLFKRTDKKGKYVVPHQEAQRKAYAWHAHDSREVLNLIGSNEKGLDKNEIKKRQDRFGPNCFSEIPAPGVFKHIWDQLRSPLVIVLLVAALLTIGLQEYIDAAVITFALTLAVAVGVLQEERASKAFRKIARSQTHTATVVRNGHKHEVPATELVPGDIVELQNGMRIPADVRLIEVKKLSINEAPLTGEWQTVEKQADPVPVGTPQIERSNMAWLGTFVAEGYALGVVVAIGDSTVMGDLAQELQSIEDAKTPLQMEMRSISRIMLFIIVGLVLAIFAIGIASGQNFTDMLLMSIAIAVASVPEGLPAAVTIILAVGMEAILSRGGLVRNLLAAETLGSTTYVLTDKTGTLTAARMVLSGIVRYDTANLDPFSWKENLQMQRILDIAIVASDAYEDSTNGNAVMRGDPVEKAILEASLNAGVIEHGVNLHDIRIDYLSFTSEHRFAAGLIENEESNRLCVNGSPEYLLEKARFVLVNDKTEKLTEESRNYFTSMMRQHTKEGKRLIGVAYKDVSYSNISDEESKIDHLLDNIVFVGLLIFNDPVRPGVSRAIKGVQEAGAEVILVTGDNADTALSIARKVGIAGSSENALTGSDMEEMTDDELFTALDTVHVFARVLPQQKLRLAELLQSRGEIVAMTGDGINDTLALKRANIGISTGSGTEVAKESSDLVLLEDSFEVIYAAIEEGRRIVTNLRKVVGYLLATSLSEVVLIASALLTGAAVPILPVQILWANIIEEGFMSVAFAFEPGEKNAMQRRPQDIHEEGILSEGMLWFIAFVVTVLGTLIGILYFYLRFKGVDIEELRSAMFLAISMDSLFIAFAFRSLTVPLWKQPLHTNLFFVGSFAVSAAALLMVLTVPFMRALVSYTPLPPGDILLVFAFSIASLLTIEIAKYIFFEQPEAEDNKL